MNVVLAALYTTTQLNWKQDQKVYRCDGMKPDAYNTYVVLYRSTKKLKQLIQFEEIFHD